MDTHSHSHTHTYTHTQYYLNQRYPVSGLGFRLQASGFMGQGLDFKLPFTHIHTHTNTSQTPCSLNQRYLVGKGRRRDNETQRTMFSESALLGGRPRRLVTPHRLHAACIELTPIHTIVYTHAHGHGHGHGHAHDSTLAGCLYCIDPYTCKCCIYIDIVLQVLYIYRFGVESTHIHTIVCVVCVCVPR